MFKQVVNRGLNEKFELISPNKILKNKNEIKEELYKKGIIFASITCF